MKLPLLAYALAAVVFTISALPAAAETPPVLTAFPTGPGIGNNQGPLISGADGNLWFLVAGCPTCGPMAVPPTIDRIMPDGIVTKFSQGLPTDSVMPAMTLGPDGNLWFTVTAPTPAIGRITPDGVITEFTQGLSALSFPDGVVAGPDGNLWFTDHNNGGNFNLPTATPAIGRITPSGIITEFSQGLSMGLMPQTILRGPDDNLWFFENNYFYQTGAVGRITPSGVITEYPLGNVSSLTNGPDGNLWFSGGAGIARITPAGIITGFTEGLSASNVVEIIAGPDGNLWFVDDGNNSAIGRITTAGVVTEFNQGLLRFADSITAGPDGNLWFTDYGNAIGRVKPDGTITEFAGSMPVGGEPSDITVGPDGNLWFVNVSFLTAPAYVGRLALPSTGTSDVALVAAVLPGSRSVAFGTTANVFATVINTSTDTAGTQCSIEPVPNLPAIFSFQSTDPQTNALTGTPNAPVTIPPGATQSFVLAFDAYPTVTVVDGNFDFQNLPPTTVYFGFACANAPAAAPIVTGMNTLLLSASEPPAPPDIVALAATPGNKGIVTISGGVGAFAVATDNLGSSGAITVSANLGGPALPVTLSICQTVPATGVCMATPAGSVSTSIDANGTPTFAIFLQASGAVPFLPATNRVFVQFADAGNAIRGLTSVAVQTQ